MASFSWTSGIKGPEIFLHEWKIQWRNYSVEGEQRGVGWGGLNKGTHKYDRHVQYSPKNFEGFPRFIVKV